MSARPVEVVLAEDSLLVRRGLEELVGEAADLRVVAVATSLDDLLDAVEATEPDVVVTDIRMPPGHLDEGLQAAARLRRTRPGIGVVVLSQYLAAPYALALFEGGSARRGYLLKDRVLEPGYLADAVRAVAAGGSFIDSLVVDALVTARERRCPFTVEALTGREREVLALVAEGLANGAVAQRLGISVRAVEKHVNAIFTKLGLVDDTACHRRVAAVLRWLAHREVDGPCPVPVDP